MAHVLTANSPRRKSIDGLWSWQAYACVCRRSRLPLPSHCARTCPPPPTHTQAPPPAWPLPPPPLTPLNTARSPGAAAAGGREGGRHSALCHRSNHCRSCKQARLQPGRSRGKGRTGAHTQPSGGSHPCPARPPAHWLHGAHQLAGATHFNDVPAKHSHTCLTASPFLCSMRTHKP